MSVLSYLTTRASDAVLSDSEKSSITRSISTIQSRLNLHFDNLKEHFQFGSSTRGTILPRNMDERSDIDYMVVFSDSGYVPQTYLDRLKKFVEKYYSTSEIYQSSPTIVLELNHIKFELVPATLNIFGYYQIPDGQGGWQTTDPNDFNQVLTEKNKNHSSLVKPTIRLAKYWNSSNGYVYSSFLFEKWIVNLGFAYCSVNQKEYLYHVFDCLSANNESTQWRKDKINRAKDIVASTRELEKNGYPITAETEIKKLIPE